MPIYLFVIQIYAIFFRIALYRALLGKLYEKIVREGVYLENIIKKVGHKKIAAHLYLIYDNMIAKRLIEETLEFLENLLFYRRVRFEIV